MSMENRVKGLLTSTVLPLLALIAVGAIIYANSLEVPFVFDDTSDIEQNAHIRITSLTPKALRDAGLNSPAPARAVANISFAINYYFHGYALRGYHLVNIAIHLVAGLGVFLLIRITMATPALRAGTRQDATAIALAAALFWLANPVQTQSVTYIVQRMNAMAAMFYVLALYLYAKGRLAQRAAHGPQHVPGEQKTVGEKAIGDGRWAMGTTTGSRVPQTGTTASKLPNIPTPRGPNTQTPKHPNTQTPKHRNTRTPKHPHTKPFWYFVGAVISGLLALGAKQIAATLPVVVLAYEWYFFQDLNGRWLKKRLGAIAAVGLALGLLAVLLIRTNQVPLAELTDYQDNQFTLGARALTQLRVVVFYVSLFVFPHPSRLNLDHDFLLSHNLLSPPTTLLALAVIVGLIVVAVRVARRQRLLSFAILWYFGNLVIESSVIPLAILFEHRLYLPSIGLAWIAGYEGIGRIQKPWLRCALVVLVVGLWGLWTIERNRVWQDPLTLWADAAAKAPGRARPQYNLAEIYHRRGMLAPAVDHYQKAIAIKPEYAKAHINLAILYKQMGKLPLAERHFQEALRLAPTDSRAVLNYGIYLFETGSKQQGLEMLNRAVSLSGNRFEARLTLADKLAALGRTQEAITHYLAAIGIEPRDDKARVNYGNALLSRERVTDAIEQYAKAIELNPANADAHYNLANALATRQQTAEARTHYQQALRLNANHLAAHSNYANLLLALGETDAALGHFVAAVRLDPDAASGHYNLATALLRMDLLDAALSHFHKTLRLKPDYTDAHLNAGVGYLRRGRPDRAVYHFQQALSLSPESKPALRNLEKANEALARAKAAAATLQGQLDAQHPSPDAWFHLGQQTAATGDLGHAATCFLKAIEVEPRFNAALTCLVDIYRELEQFDQALAWVEKMVTYWPQSPSVHFTMACILARQNRMAAAIAALEKALAHGLGNWGLRAVSPELDSLRSAAAFARLGAGDPATPSDPP